MKLKELKLHERNPRKITPEKLDKLTKSITDLPQMMELRPIIVDENNVILGGNMRYRALKKLGYKDIPDEWVKRADQLTEDQKREFVIKDNVGFGDWEIDILQEDYSIDELTDWGLDIDLNDKSEELEEDASSDQRQVRLSDIYCEIPQSILDTQKKEWIDRKKEWVDILGLTNAGRESSITYNTKNKCSDKFNDDIQNELKSLGGTSIFDPVLCELMIEWFSKPDDSVLDPFAGGCVRGVVSEMKGRRYTGVDLSHRQIEQNNSDASRIGVSPSWIQGDSSNIDNIVDGKYDLILSCPPYADLEVYSDDPNDLSNMPHDKFFILYRDIIKKSCDMLHDDRFIVWVVGEVRSKNDKYISFVPETIKAFEDAGVKYYNEIILKNNLGTGRMFFQRYFKGSRKVLKRHQNVLVFLKGDSKRATKRLGDCVFNANMDISEDSED